MKRELGFYRLTWTGLPAVGYLYRDDPRPWDWDTHPPERWTIMFITETLIGPRTAFTTAADLPEEMIGERIDFPTEDALQELANRIADKQI